MSRVAAFDRWLWRSNKPIPAAAQTVLVETTASIVRVRDSGDDRGGHADRSGPPVVFLCDPPATVELYDELIAELAPNFRVLVVELPGFGQSRANTGAALEFLGSVAALEAALLQLQLPPVVICAPCICSFVATEIVKRASVAVAGLVLIQAPDRAAMQAWTDRMDPKRRLRIPYLGQLIARSAARRITAFWFRFATAKSHNHQPMVEQANAVLGDGGAYPLATMLQRWGDHVSDHRLDLPALLLWGQQDRSHAATDRQGSKAHAVNGQLAMLDDCGHFPELEAPQAFAAELRRFVADNLAGLSNGSSM